MNNNPSQKSRRRIRLRHGSYALAITCIVIAAAIVINVLATALAARFPLDIDLTADQTYSLSDKNEEYLREVSRPVTLTLCADEDDYSSGQYLSYYYNAVDTTGEYYAQTLSLLKDYPKYNSNIQFQCADPQLPSFSDIQQRFPNQDINYGDLLVESTFELNGQTISRQKVISFEDMYELYDATGYAAMGYSSYTISGSNLETALTSAIYSVTSDKTTKVGFLASHSNAEDVANLQTDLEQNNYEVTTIDNLLSQEIPEDMDMLLITAPTSDFSGDELSKIDDFLDNDGKRGKALLFFAGSASPELPNLYDFLDEWGIHVSSGVLYETSDANYVGDPTTIGLSNAGSDYTSGVNTASNVLYVATGCVPMEIGFESQGNRTTTALMSSSDTVVVRPAGAGEEWSPSGSGGTTYSVGIMSKDTIYGESMAELHSYVVAYASTDLISSAWDNYSFVNNNELVLSSINAAAGREEDSITITAKVISQSAFDIPVTMFVLITALIVFAFVLPVLSVVVGIIIWVRRKNR